MSTNKNPSNYQQSSNQPNLTNSFTKRIFHESQIKNSPIQINSTQPSVMNFLPIIQQQSKLRYDNEFNQRKVSRLQADMILLQEQLSLTKYKLTKAEDYQRKYQIVFKSNQKIRSQLEIKQNQIFKLKRKIQELKRKNDQVQNQISILKEEITIQKMNSKQLKQQQQKLTNRLQDEKKKEKMFVQQQYQKEINILKQNFISKQLYLKTNIQKLKQQVQSNKIHQKSLNFKLQSIKNQKNKQITRLQDLTKNLKQQVSSVNKSTDQRFIKIRTDLIGQTQNRIQNIENLAADIQQALMNQIRNLNSTLKQKNSQIQFILQADQKFIQENQKIQNGLKSHIQRLQDKIFIIQRQNQIEIFQTIDRLQNQYRQNVNNLNNEFENIKKTHFQQVDQLKQKISNLEKQNTLLIKQNIRVEEEHKKLASDKQQAVRMLSQKIISMQSSKDIDLRYYTTSMTEIQTDAKTKLEDLHTAIQSKNTQFQILNAQMNLKNIQISSLIEEINKLRSQNRQKIKNLSEKNYTEQNSLNNHLIKTKKQIQQLRSKINQLESQLNDQQAQSDLKISLISQDLQSQKQANQTLKSRNNFLYQWSKQLQRDLKAERISNVNILHDTNISRRQTVQIRQQVKVELQAIKDKQVQQLRNIFKLEKDRLQTELIKKQHQLRDKKEEIARLLVEYKKLQNKVGKTLKYQKGIEEEGKSKATLNAQILLTENILKQIQQ